MEHNQRLREELARPRVMVSVAAMKWVSPSPASPKGSKSIQVLRVSSLGRQTSRLVVHLKVTVKPVLGYRVALDKRGRAKEHC